MKSVIKTNDLKWEIKCPCLMTADSCLGAIVVLFNDHRCGVVVHSEWEFRPIGYYSEEWVMSAFVPFNETIELSNN